MDQRYEKLGIKQTIRLEWMNRTLEMLLAGMTETQIRKELDSYLSTQKQSGGIATACLYTGHERGLKTYGLAIPILCVWLCPRKGLQLFRDSLLAQAEKLPSCEWLPLHWALLCAAYPFWYQVARQVGGLLKLQTAIAQPQIFQRLKQQYGDRQTVSRNARYTVRSFVAWGVLQDTEKRGEYRKTKPAVIINSDAYLLLIESFLRAIPEGRATLLQLQNHAAAFPFSTPPQQRDWVFSSSDRLESFHHGLQEEYVQLKHSNLHFYVKCDRILKQEDFRSSADE